jgi:hypothetical protein
LKRFGSVQLIAQAKSSQTKSQAKPSQAESNHEADGSMESIEQMISSSRELMKSSKLLIIEKNFFFNRSIISF